LAKKKSVVMTRGVDFVPVDNYYPLKEKAKVIEHQKAFYTATLTQSDLANDDNKFFIIQALQVGEPPGDEHILFTRWGRVGVPGQIKFSESPLTRKEVIRQYNSKIQEKLARGGYKPIDVTYEYASLNVEEEEINAYFGESSLPWKVQELVKVIFDRKMIHYNIK
jgi:predicted DNA-binding WGR domain protein